MHRKRLRLLLSLLFLVHPFLRAGTDVIRDIQKLDAWDLVRHVSEKEGIKFLPEDMTDSTRTSQFIEFDRGKRKYRLRLRFAYSSPGLSLSTQELQVQSRDSWKTIREGNADIEKSLAGHLLLALEEGHRIIQTKRKSDAYNATTDVVESRNRADGIQNLMGDYTVLPDCSKAKILAFDDDARYQFSEGWCAVRRKDRWGTIDTLGRYGLDFVYHVINGKYPCFREGACSLWSVSDSLVERCLPIRPDGKLLFQNNKYHTLSLFSKGISLAEELTSDGGRSLRLIHTSGLPVEGAITPGFSKGKAVDFPGFTEGLCPMFDAAMNGWGYIDTLGRWAIRPDVRLVSLGFFHEGMAFIQEKAGKKWGAIDAKGNLVIPFMFDEKPGDFSEGLSAFKSEDGQIGYMDQKGTVVISPRYDPVGSGFPFVQGNTIAKKGETTYSISSSGQEVRLKGGIRDEYKMLKNGWISYREWNPKRGWVFGIMRTNGEVLIEPNVFTFIGEWNNGLAYARARINETIITGFINIDSNFVIIRQNP